MKEAPLGEEKPKTVFDVFKSLSQTKQGFPGDLELYDPFIINRTFAKFPETLFLANEMNGLSNLPKEIQRDFYLTGVMKKNRFAPWFKTLPPKEELQFIQTQCQVTKKKAQVYWELLKEEDRESLKLGKGGLSKIK